RDAADGRLRALRGDPRIEALPGSARRARHGAREREGQGARPLGRRRRVSAEVDLRSAAAARHHRPTALSVSMVRVLIAEDSVTARRLLVEILGADPEIAIVGEATNGEEAVAMTTRLRPSVVTMDIRMPRLDGFEATRQ